MMTNYPVVRHLFPSAMDDKLLDNSSSFYSLQIVASFVLDSTKEGERTKVHKKQCAEGGCDEGERFHYP